MSRLDLLSDLQKLDTQIQENSKSRQALEVHLADDSQVAAASGAFETAQKKESGLRARLRALELEDKGLDDHIHRVETRLYDGKLTNPKELSGLERDDEMLKRQRVEIEDRMLELMTEIEKAEAGRSHARKLLDQVTAAHSSSSIADRARLAELDMAARELSARRDEARTRIVPEDLLVYDDLLKSKRGRAVSQIKGNACTACGYAVPSGIESRARMGNELVFCVNCGRILAT